MLTPSQHEATLCFERFMADSSPYTACLLRGYAGTGKTSLIRGLTQALVEMGSRICLMAPTGRAARRLSIATGMPAYTIHRLIYRASSAIVEEGGRFACARGGQINTVFIIDEASMIGSQIADSSAVFGSGDLLADLLAYVHETEGAKLFFVGDTAQLPPIGSNLSPALDSEGLVQRYGLKVYDATLTDVVRQAETSGILQNATALRKLLVHGSSQVRRIKINNSFPDIHTISGAELIDCLDGAYRRYGREEVMVICGSNKRTLAYNLGIRSQVLYNDSEIERGDRLVITRNNYAYAKRKDKSDFLANGEIIEVRRIGRTYELYGHRFVDIDIYLEDRGEELSVCIIADALLSENAQLSYAEREALYTQVSADYADQPSVVKRRKSVQINKYWQALEVKYANALTCHKAQGGQWSTIFVDMGLIEVFESDEAKIRWFYTAITRAKREVYLVNTPVSMLTHRAH